MLPAVTKKWRLFRTWASRHPLWCAWQVTYRCNFRCSFCHYWRDPLGAQAEPSPSDYADASAKLASFGSLLISLAGGEPMLRTDLPEIVRAVGQFHFPFVTTNGWFVTPESARDLMAAGVWGVSVSIDYADPARHDAQRGMDGAWAQAWKAVEMLDQARMHPWQRVNVMCVLVRDNLDDLPALLEMAAKHNAWFMVQPYGKLKTGSAAHEHRDGPVSQRLLKLRRRYPNFLSNPRYLERFDQFLDGGVAGCRAGRAFFNIDSAGDVAICVERKHDPVANLFTDSPSVIHRRLRAASAGNPCMRCWYNCRGEVESLYHPRGILDSLPTLLKDTGRARTQSPTVERPAGSGSHAGSSDTA